MSCGEIIKRELREIFRLDPRRILFLFFAVLLYLFLFYSLYYPGTVRQVSTIICDESQSALSRELTQALSDSDSLAVHYFTVDEEEMRDLLAVKQAFAAIHIPKDFSTDIQLGQATTVLFMASGNNIVLTNATATAVQEVIENFSDKVAARNAALRLNYDEHILAQKIAPVHCRLRLPNNPTQTYLFFFCIGLSLTAFQQGLLFAMAASLHYDFQNQAEISSTPLGKLLSVKFLLHWGCALVALSCFLFCAAQVCGIPVRAPWWELLALGAAFSFVILLLGMVLAPLCKTELQFVKLSLFYVVPAFIFSGYTWPLMSMPEDMQLLAKIFFPLTWVLDGWRSLMLSGVYAGLTQSLIALSLPGTICMLLAPRAFRYGCKNFSEQ